MEIIRNSKGFITIVPVNEKIIRTLGKPIKKRRKIN
jgi:hypothetical protein